MNENKTPGIMEVANFCKELNLKAELVGRWIWVSFSEKPDTAVRKALKDFGFRWSGRRGKWAHNCGTPSKSAMQSNPWDKYDHSVINFNERSQS
jgi:hypothetical protein